MPTVKVQHEITNDNQEKTETRNTMFSYMIGQATQAAARTKYRMKFNIHDALMLIPEGLAQRVISSSNSQALGSLRCKINQFYTVV